jgi:hypothetical protein
MIDDIDYAVRIRDAAVTVLLAQNTLAGANVEAERIDPVESGDTPRIIVVADETAESDDPAGALPVFRVTLHLSVECFVERARKQDAVKDLDCLVSQVKEALFGDPGWVSLPQNIASYSTARKFEGRDRQIVGQARLLITCTWRASYPPRVTTPLDTVTFSPQKPTAAGATPLAPQRTDGNPAVEISLPQSS